MLLSGCSPGLVIHLYNATEETLTVTNPPFRPVITIQPHTSADVGAVGGGVFIVVLSILGFILSKNAHFYPSHFTLRVN
jgi:hypothetical protein